MKEIWKDIQGYEWLFMGIYIVDLVISPLESFLCNLSVTILNN